MTNLKSLFKVSGVCLVILVPSVDAAVISSVDRAAFQAAVASGTIQQQNFDSLVAGTLLGATTDITYDASMGDVIVTNSFLVTTTPNGIGSTSAGFFLPNETVSFLFSTPISAFAIDVNTFANTDGAYQIALNTGDVVTSLFEAFPGTVTGQFFGLVSDTPFSQVILSAVTGNVYTLDTLVYGDAAPVVVPLPAAVWLLGSALVGLLGFRRFRPR